VVLLIAALESVKLRKEIFLLVLNFIKDSHSFSGLSLFWMDDFYSRLHVGRKVVVELERRRGHLLAMEQERRGPLQVRRVSLMAVEALQGRVRVGVGVAVAQGVECHAGASANAQLTYLLHVLGGREQHRRLGEVLHAVELGPIRHRMVQLVQLLSARSCHLSLGGPSLLVARLAFGAL